MIRPDRFYKDRHPVPRMRPSLRLLRGGLALFVAVVAAIWLMMPGCETTPRGTQSARPTAKPATQRAAQFSSEPTVRVRIAVSVAAAHIEAPAGRLWVGPTDAPLGKQFTGPITIQRAGGDFVIHAEQGNTMRWTLATLSVRALDGPNVRCNGGTYPNTLVLHGFDTTATLDVVNHLPMEQYLPGVLSRELYASWHIETFRAQAIAARSYALAGVARWRNRWYDLESTTASQAYGGANVNARAVQAVLDTRGLALTYNGDVLKAYYSSSSGGTGQDAAAVFPEQPDLPPLRGSEHGGWSSASPHFRWGPITRDRLVLAQRIAAWAAANKHAATHLRGLASATIIKRNSVGRPTAFRVTDDDGRAYDFDAESFRFACNFAAPGLPTLSTAHQLKSSHVDVAVRGGQVVFYNGRGHGHGAGMDQYGAQAMALKGYIAPQILAFYYPGAQGAAVVLTRQQRLHDAFAFA